MLWLAMGVARLISVHLGPPISSLILGSFLRYPSGGMLVWICASERLLGGRKHSLHLARSLKEKTMKAGNPIPSVSVTYARNGAVNAG